MKLFWRINIITSIVINTLFAVDVLGTVFQMRHLGVYWLVFGHYSICFDVFQLLLGLLVYLLTYRKRGKYTGLYLFLLFFFILIKIALLIIFWFNIGSAMGSSPI